MVYLDDKIVARQDAAARATAVGGLGADVVTPGLVASGAIMRSQPRTFQASWAFVLDPIDGEHTRLSERVRVAYAEIGPWNRVTGPFVGAAVFLMTRRQMLGIKKRAERLISRGPITPAAEELPVEMAHQELIPA